ncbi:MAG: hypothetical protein AB7I27_01585 [Bacteriovoracaceae bacterium]
MFKSLFILFFCLTSAHAHEVILAQISAKEVESYDEIKTRFVIDAVKSEVSALAQFKFKNEHCHLAVLNMECYTTMDILGEMKSIIPGMILENNKLIYRDKNVEIDCGEVKKGRVFTRRDIIHLNGQCKLDINEVETSEEHYFQLLFKY